MAYIGLKLGRHTVQAGVWNGEIAIEAALPRLQKGAAWRPVLAREATGAVVWSHDVWSRLSWVTLAPDSLPVALERAPAGETAWRVDPAPLFGPLWQQLEEIGAKLGEGTGRHTLCIASTLPVTPGLREALVTAAGDAFHLAPERVLDVSACALAGHRQRVSEPIPLEGRILHLHLGGEAAQIHLWEATAEPGGQTLRRVFRGTILGASVGSILDALYRYVSEEKLYLLIDAGAPPQARATLRRHVLHTLAESRGQWTEAWQYRVPEGYLLEAQWLPRSPIQFPEAEVASILRQAGDVLMGGVRLALARAGWQRGELAHVIVTGAGAGSAYLGPRLREEFPDQAFASRPETVPALGAARIAYYNGSAESGYRYEFQTEGEGSMEELTPEPATSPVPPALPQPVSPPSLPSGDVAVPSETSPDAPVAVPVAIPLGMEIGARRAVTALVAPDAGGLLFPEVVRVGESETVPALVGLPRAQPEQRCWGLEAQALQSDPAQYAVLHSLLDQLVSGGGYVVMRTDPLTGERVSTGNFTAAEVSGYFLENYLHAVRKALYQRLDLPALALGNVVLAAGDGWTEAQQAAVVQFLCTLSIPVGRVRFIGHARAAALSSLSLHVDEPELSLLVLDVESHVLRAQAVRKSTNPDGRIVYQEAGPVFRAERWAASLPPLAEAGEALRTPLRDTAGKVLDALFGAGGGVPRKEGVSLVLLTGAGAALGLVRETVEAYFQGTRARVMAHPQPELAAGLGAALEAALQAQEEASSQAVLEAFTPPGRVPASIGVEGFYGCFIPLVREGAAWDRTYVSNLVLPQAGGSIRLNLLKYQGARRDPATHLLIPIVRAAEWAPLVRQELPIPAGFPADSLVAFETTVDAQGRLRITAACTTPDKKQRGPALVLLDQIRTR